MSFGFRLIFRSAPGRTIRGVGVEDHHILTLPGVIEKVVLRQLTSSAPGLPERFVLVGSGFTDDAAARSCGERLIKALPVVGCDIRMGIDVGRDRITSFVPQSTKHELQEKFNVQLRDSIHGLDVFPEEPPVVYSANEGHGTADYSVDHFPEKLAKEFTVARRLDSKLALALDLYNLTQFERAIKARFLHLVSIVEVLAERARRPQGIKSQLDECEQLIQDSSLASEQKNTILNGLRNLKQESIGEACRRLITEQLGEKSADYFSQCYKARSELLHEGETKRPEIQDWVKLDEIVRSVLLKRIRNAE